MSIMREEYGFDFGSQAEAYAQFRPPYPPRLFEELAARGVGLTGQRILDAGSGTGLVSLELARRGCAVSALDVSAQQLAKQRELAASEGLSIETFEAGFEHSGLPAQSFDCISAATCWHYFEPAAAARETRRLLRPGGRLAVIYIVWLPVEGSLAQRTEELILKHNPAWTLAGLLGLPNRVISELTAAQLGPLDIVSFDHPVRFSPGQWIGRMQSCGGAGAGGMDSAAWAAFSRELAALLARDYPQGAEIPHRSFAAVLTLDASEPAGD
ncbi:class I SAM-dependent methyltransferase [bacterium]|nr:class I SAM-dependent methyltransferase [bacterium]